MGRLVGRGAARVERQARSIETGDGAEGGLPAIQIPPGDVAFTQAEGVPAVEDLKDGRPVGGPEGAVRARPDRAAQHVGVPA